MHVTNGVPQLTKTLWVTTNSVLRNIISLKRYSSSSALLITKELFFGVSILNMILTPNVLK